MEDLFRLLRDQSAEREALTVLHSLRDEAPLEDQPPTFAKPAEPKRRKTTVKLRSKTATKRARTKQTPVSMGGGDRPSETPQSSSGSVPEVTVPLVATPPEERPPSSGASTTTTIPSSRPEPDASIGQHRTSENAPVTSSASDEQRVSRAVAPLIQYLQNLPQDRARQKQFERQLDPRMFIEHPLIPAPSESARRMRRITHDWIWQEQNRINYGAHRLSPFAQRLEQLEDSQDHRISLKRTAEQLRALDRMLVGRRRRITIDEPTHEYRVDGERIQQNVTSSLDELCGEFHEDRTIDRMLANTYRWKQNKHYATCNFDEFGNELTREEKAERLKRKWRESREDGTRLHKFIEQQYEEPATSSTTATVTPPSAPNAAAYFNFEDIRMFNGWLLVATEYPVYDVACSIAGTVDAIYMPNPLQPRQVVLVDWKRAAITTTVGNMTYEHPLMSQYAKGNYWKYAMQLNIYREILERNYDLHVLDVFLVSMPPDESTCHVLGVPRMLEAKVFLEVLRERRTSTAAAASAVPHT